MAQKDIIEWDGLKLTFAPGKNGISNLANFLEDCVIISPSASKSGSWEVWADEDTSDPDNKMFELEGEGLTDVSHVRIVITAMGVGYISGQLDGEKKVKHAFNAVLQVFTGRGSPELSDLIPNIVAETWSDEDERAWRKERCLRRKGEVDRGPREPYAPEGETRMLADLMNRKKQSAH